jgi:hypothetical protein
LRAEWCLFYSFFFHFISLCSFACWSAYKISVESYVFVLRKEKRQAPLAPSANSQSNIKISSLSASAPPKPPRMIDLNDPEIENINPTVKSYVQPAVKYQAPLAPDMPPVMAPAGDNNPVVAESSARTASEDGNHISSVKLVFNTNHQTESPGKVTITPIKQTVASPAKTYNSPVKLAAVSPAKVDMIHKPQAAKRTVVPAIGKNVELKMHDSLDMSINEPTRQPVSVRLAAWQSKQIAAGNQEPLPVASRVRNYEKKVTTADQPTPSRTAVHLRAKTEVNRSPGNKSVLNKGSPRAGAWTAEDKPVSPSSKLLDRKPSGRNNIGSVSQSPLGKALHGSPLGRRPSNKTALESIVRSPGKNEGSPLSKCRLESPLKSSSSPQKLAPATRAVQEKLLQLCEVTGRNEAAERERQQRAAEIQALGTRWKSETDTSVCMTLFMV